MAINSSQELFNQLLVSTTPIQVKEILNEIGDYPDVGLDNPFGKLELFWHAYGDKISNYSSVGLASKPGRSLTERITNAMDAIIEEHSTKTSSRPSNPQSAVNEWFGRPFSDSESGLYTWNYPQGNYDRKVGVVLYSSQIKESPTIDVVDYGIGIAPEKFPSTILSLQEGNKIRKKILIGSFGQGGASTLFYSRYILIISRQIWKPETISFTLIKEVQLGEEYDVNCYAYLAQKDSSGNITVPSLNSTVPLSIFQTSEKLRLSDLMHGTLVRHFSFNLPMLYNAIGPREGNLYHFLHCSMFDPLIPFQIIDLRNPENIKQEICTGSRNRLMKLRSLQEQEIDSSNSHVKLYRPIFYITPHGSTSPCIKVEYWVVFNYEKKKNKKTGQDYLELRGDSNSLFVQKKHLAVLTLNGQNQGELTVAQLMKDLGLDMIARHLIIHIDATYAPKDVKNQIFTTNRENLRDGDVLESIKQELRRQLVEDSELKALDNELVEKATSEVNESTDDEVKKQIVKLLREAGYSPISSGDTAKEGNQEKTTTDKEKMKKYQKSEPLQTLLYPEVTRFEIVVPKERMDIRLNDTAVLLVETDADSKYEKDIRIKIEPEHILDIASHVPLQGGRIRWRVRTGEKAKVGDTGKISVTLTKPNGDQLKDEIEFEVSAPIEKQSKDDKGLIPDFEVIPATPGDEKWKKAWDEVSEDSEEVFSVAYKPTRLGPKTIVYYSTVFPSFKTLLDKLKIENPSLSKYFETNYKVWIGYHAILQQNGIEKEGVSDDEEKFNKEREKERSRVAQMEVKQALRTAELMLVKSKQEAVIAQD